MYVGNARPCVSHRQAMDRLRLVETGRYNSARRHESAEGGRAAERDGGWGRGRERRESWQENGKEKAERRTEAKKRRAVETKKVRR